jgi:purine-binding chemotaxis protein CheW
MITYTRIIAAGETYAVPVMNVLEIVDLGRPAIVPGARGEILGIRSLHGQILPVIGLSQVLGTAGLAERRGTPGPGTTAPLLVTEASGIRAGFAIDQVIDVGELPDPTEEPESEFLVGTMLHQGELIGVIDVAAIFEWLRRES